jgi:hypothetical protein
VRWYFRFRLNLRDIEELLFERAMIATYETIRCWCEWNERPTSVGGDTQGVDLIHRARNRSAKRRIIRIFPGKSELAIVKHTIVGVDIAKNVQSK